MVELPLPCKMCGAENCVAVKDPIRACYFCMIEIVSKLPSSQLRSATNRTALMGFTGYHTMVNTIGECVLDCETCYKLYEPLLAVLEDGATLQAVAAVPVCRQAAFDVWD